jgi:uncharacterized cupredoxin-like copper-binding protein
MRKLALLISMLGIMLLGNLQTAAAATAQPEKVNVTLSDFKVATSATRLPAGQPIQLVITNHGSVAHEVVLEKAGAVDEAVEIEDQESGEEEAEVENIAPGETRTVVWTVAEAGDYQFACHILGHFAAGMVIPVSFVSGMAEAAEPSASQVSMQMGSSSEAATDAAHAMASAGAGPAPKSLPVTGSANASSLVPGWGLALLAGALISMGAVVRRRATQ